MLEGEIVSMKTQQDTGTFLFRVADLHYVKWTNPHVKCLAEHQNFQLRLEQQQNSVWTEF
jgi:hypothetical protein